MCAGKHDGKLTFSSFANKRVLDIISEFPTVMKLDGSTEEIMLVFGGPLMLNFITTD